jgi:small redox-active disulfide protein 2
MATVTVYGPGCARCKQAENVVQKVVAEVGGDIEVQKVTDYQAIAQAGIMSTPAIAIDGVVKVAGRVPKADELKQWLAK